MEYLLPILAKVAGVKVTTWAGLGIVGVVVSFLLKKYITASFLAVVGDTFEAGGFYFGKIVTGGLSHWRWTKPIWNNLVEPYVLVLVEQAARIFVGLSKGLQSDNPSTKE